MIKSSRDDSKKSRKKSVKRQSLINEYFVIRKCKAVGCQKVSMADQEALIGCECCHDAYHWFCSEVFNEPPTSDDEFICKKCLSQYREVKKRKVNEVEVSNPEKEKVACCMKCD